MLRCFVAYSRLPGFRNGRRWMLVRISRLDELSRHRASATFDTHRAYLLSSRAGKARCVPLRAAAMRRGFSRAYGLRCAGKEGVSLIFATAESQK